MKKIIYITFSFLCAAVLCACSSGDTKKSSVFQNKGDRVVTLDSNPTTGYSWKLDKEYKKFTVVKDEYVAPAQKPGVVGAWGKQYITLRPVAGAKGKETLRFVYIRPWEKKAKPEKEYSVTFEIE